MALSTIRCTVGPSLCFAGATAIAPVLSHADVITAVWNGNTSFSYEITHMPDLDQRRMPVPGIFGLPNNGAMYCAPTGSMNMMMYIGNHGFPAVLPGPGNWQSNNLYNAASLNLAVMGVLMDTDPVDGTSGGWHTGTRDWLDQNSEGAKFNSEHIYFTGALGPNLNALAKKGVQGHLVSLAYGRYTPIGTHKGLPYYQRTGGHVVTMAKAFRSGNDQKLWVRDPADDAMNLTTQSPFANRLWTVQGKAVYVKINDEPHLRLVSALDFDPKAETVRFIDEMLTIRPKVGYSFTNIGQFIAVQLINPFPMPGANAPPAVTPIAAGNFIDGVVSFDGTEALVIRQPAAGGDALLEHVDLSTEEPSALATIPGALHVALSPGSQVYVVTPVRIFCIDLTQEPPQSKDAELPALGSAMNFDLVRNEVVVLSVEHRRIVRYRNLNQPPTQMTIPRQIPLKGEARVGVDPTTGLYWFLTQASSTLYGWGVDRAGNQIFQQATAGGLGQPTSFDFDDHGHLFICDDEMILEMEMTAAAGWQPVADSAFAGPHAGKSLRITKSQTNFDPLLHTGPAHVNIDPEELEFGLLVPDCDADVNRDGVVNVLDLLMVINGWGDCPFGPCPLDIDGNGAADVVDLLAVINGWGACP